MEIDDNLRSLMTTRLSDARAPGASVALVIDGELTSAGVGHANAAGDIPLRADARFGFYSVTKTVIAAVVMRLVERGEIDLAAPIGQYVAGLTAGAGIPVRMVLNHSGGFPDYGGMTAYHEAVRAHPSTPWETSEFLSRTLADGMLFPPGEGWRYSNIGYMLLRLAIEDVTGESFREAVRRNTGLGVATSLADMVQLTPGYGGDPPVNVIPRYHPGWVSHGLAMGTAEELARFMEALFGGEIVHPRSLESMLSAIAVGETHPWMTTPSYGLGLMVDPDHRFGVVAGHTGGGPGYSAAAYRFPDVAGRTVTAVALVNADGGDVATGLVFSLVARLAGTT